MWSETETDAMKITWKVIKQTLFIQRQQTYTRLSNKETFSRYFLTAHQVVYSPHDFAEPTRHLQIAFVEPQHEKLKGSYGEMAVADCASFAARE